MKHSLACTLFALLWLGGCQSSSESSANDAPETNVMRIESRTLVDSFIGNGPQWGGYDVVPSWTGQATLSDADWNTLFKRVSFMRPGLVRIMVSQGWNYISGDTFDPHKSDAILCRILEYCQQNAICVQFGEWGHVGGSAVDAQWVENSASFLSYLIEERGFTCIRYFTVVNEPNGNWSSTNGSYALWSQLVRSFHRKFEEKGLLNKVQLIGPDAAVWTIAETAWMSNTKNELHEEVTAYDIHTYPDDQTVYSTRFQQLLDAYRAASDKSRPIILGELGFKYTEGSALGNSNLEAIQADPYAADDSQMHVYDAFYGIDMADATIQAMRASYSGVTYWMLDDAMYNDDGSSTSTRLKRWGCWNILGAEKFDNADDEKIRPWFYTVSLLSRYFPGGSQIHAVTLPTPVLSGLRAVAASKAGKYTLAIVNAGNRPYTFTLKADSGVALSDLRLYEYVSGAGATFQGPTDQDGFPTALQSNVTLGDLSEDGVQITMPAKSFRLYTNME